MNQENDTTLNDDVLVTKEDLETLSDYSDKSVENLWKDEEVLTQLKEEMKRLESVKKEYKRYPQEIIIKAVAEIISKVGWGSVDRMNANIQKICNRKYIPFSFLALNKKTGVRDIWVQNVILENGEFCGSDGTCYKKHEIYLSKHFCEEFKNYIKQELENKVKFWVFSSQAKGNQTLNLHNINKKDHNRLLMFNNIEDLIMFRFTLK